MWMLAVWLAAQVPATAVAEAPRTQVSEAAVAEAPRTQVSEAAAAVAEPPKERRVEHWCFLPLEDEWELDLLAGCRACRHGARRSLLRMRRHFLEEIMRLANDSAAPRRASG